MRLRLRTLTRMDRPDFWLQTNRWRFQRRLQCVPSFVLRRKRQFRQHRRSLNQECHIRLYQQFRTNSGSTLQKTAPTKEDQSANFVDCKRQESIHVVHSNSAGCFLPKSVLPRTRVVETVQKTGQRATSRRRRHQHQWKESGDCNWAKQGLPTAEHLHLMGLLRSFRPHGSDRKRQSK